MAHSHFYKFIFSHNPLNNKIVGICTHLLGHSPTSCPHLPLPLPPEDHCPKSRYLCSQFAFSYSFITSVCFTEKCMSFDFGDQNFNFDLIHF